MDALLDRLWELANEDDDPRSARRNERVAEARALWRALEVLLASLKPSELEVGDGTFTKTLACVRSVLSDPSYWVATPPDDSTSGDASDDSLMTLFVCVNRVLLKLAARGAHEREALVRDGLVDLVVRCGESMQQNSSLSASEAAAALQTLQSLAVDSKNRPNLQVSQTIGLSIALMEKHSTVFAVQLRACQFLHQMALEEDCKLHIGRHGGLLAVTKALLRFAEEAELVVTALDVLFFLCVELEYQDSSVENIPVGSVNASILQGVVSAVVGAMRHLQSVELVQANGVAVLNSIVMHPPMKPFLCSINIWDIAENGLSTTATDDAACDFVELLDTLLRDPATYEMLRQMLVCPLQRGHSPIKSRLKALKGQIEALCHSQVASKETEARMVFIASRLQSVLDEESCALSCAATGSTADQLISADDDYDGYSNFIYAQGHPPVLFNASTHCEDDNGDELPVDSRGNTSNVDDSQSSVLFLKENTGCIKKVNQKADDNTLSVMMRGNKYNSITFAELNQLDELCKMPNGAKICSRVHSNSTQQIPDTIAMHPRQGISNGDAQAWHDLCEANTREAQRIQIECHENTLNKEAEKWQDLYEASTRELQRLQNSFHELNERYRIVLRRSKEQAKLLNLQNVRITNHGNEHQQVLRRLRTLETSLDESNRRYEVEKAIRSAEAVQSEQLSLALETSLREAKSLAAQQSSASRELQQKESVRTEYMMRTRESNQDKQRMEVERDNALIRIEILKQEKIEAIQQLANSRQEGLESLMMREEDVDARRPGIFSELAKTSTAYKGFWQESRSGTCSSSTQSRRKSLPTKTLSTQLIETMNSAPLSKTNHRSASVHPLRTIASGGFNDDVSSIDTSDIQSCLISVFESLNPQCEETKEDGVHVSIVRRFFLESGLVQAPQLLSADVDVVLAGVLAQAQSNRKNSIVRKDFNVAPQHASTPPIGWAKMKKQAPPTNLGSTGIDLKRFRFFNQDAFNEAVTLVGIRRFPRFDLLRVLQTVVALYLRPYMRQQHTLNLSSTSLRNKPLMVSRVSCTTTAGSPSQVCARAMKTILTGLALSLGHRLDNDIQPSKRISEGSVYCPPVSINGSHKREDVVYSMLEMNGVLNRELRPLGTICEFYSALHLPNASAASAISFVKNDLLGLSFDLVLNFAIDFEIIPSFMDRVSLKHLHTEVAGLIRSYFALHDKDPPSGADAETLKKVAFGMILARLAIEIFSSKLGYETPLQQITGLLQWLDNSPGREKIMRRSGIPLVIRFSRQLYAVKP